MVMHLSSHGFPHTYIFVQESRKYAFGKFKSANTGQNPSKLMALLGSFYGKKLDSKPSSQLIVCTHAGTHKIMVIPWPRVVNRNQDQVHGHPKRINQSWDLLQLYFLIT